MPTLSALVALKILTLNIWGLPNIGFKALSPLRAERVMAICEELKRNYTNNGYDLIALQEAWTKEDRNTLKNCGYPYSYDSNQETEFLDHGLMILSRYPLGRTDTLHFSESGITERLFIDGEAMAKKSVILAEVILPKLGSLYFANTHLVSIYPEDGIDIYQDQRENQLKEMTTWVNTYSNGKKTIYAGDLNFNITDPSWTVVTELMPNFQQAESAGRDCTVCPPHPIHPNNEGKLDYILASPDFKVLSGGVVFNKPVQIMNTWLYPSDHFGYTTSVKPIW